MLGLPVGVDLLTFNPYAAGVNAAEALAMEKASQQIMTVVNAFSASAEGAGANPVETFNAALKGEKPTDATASAADKTLDLTQTNDLLLIKTQVTTEVASVAGVNQTAFTAMANDTATAVGHVNSKIATVTELNSDASKNIFSTAPQLNHFNQISSGVLLNLLDAGE